ncbi:MAG: ATP-binding protein, partial [Polaromonas sp.]|nr:ATP-binding protein [Polaromonas sp.]
GSSLVSALRVVERGRLEDIQVAEVLKSCIDDLKLAIDSMEPVEADLLLLLATLRFRLGSRLESTGITLRWEISDVPTLDWLDPRNALHILRILQEAFANILKHAQANEIRVTTAASDGWVCVGITDNGKGFAVEAALDNGGKGGKGLSNQRRRAQAIGGDVTFESSAAGTRLTLRLPVQRTAAV